ncbi:DUF4276 family protein [Serratia bockelmannii]|uniref:DUF4276 family protein n=1 Tax=Serratia TaxID=613 RepID=UPI000F8E2C36|nr:DUF4276 family protein [Serratia ureilytica]MBN5291162.1 DUF4276 family protein [Serratia marcescens]MBH2640577.1 DUF4276 family protein [Serratia ureilytica]HEJ0403705.1 DUF4276 family protein [Serratia marcescens]HEJ7314486.1 DUF4276 family protein [Serratia marcescens]HEJ8031154.1 DUF4276 family protein [Serratia marcescens]
MRISIATEDVLTEEIITKIILSNGRFEIIHKLGKRGNGYLISKLNNFNELSRGLIVVVVFDLDLKPCPVRFKEELERTVANKSDNLKLVISVREVESWILADREGFGSYFKISKDKIDRTPDALLDPKDKIINLARYSKDSAVKRGIPPVAGAASKVGLSYNRLLTDFIQQEWDINRAIQISPSLATAMATINELLEEHKDD